MSNAYPYIISDQSIVIHINGRGYTVNRGDQRFDECLTALRNQDFDAIPGIFDLKGRMVDASNGGLYLLNGILHCDRYPIPSRLGNRIVAMYRQNLPVTHMGAFLENLMQNPSPDAREELYGFIEACSLPITPDGHFLAYKMVRSDFRDIYTGKMDNSVGQILEMPREAVDNNRNRTCSSGLHFCSEGYLGHYGTRNSDQVVIVKINPRDVVSIPTDYNNAKGRACRYEVVDAITWDEKIKDYYEDKYSEDVDDTPVTEDFRWEVRNRDDDSLVARFSSRQKAREHIWYDNPDDLDWYVRDRLDDDPDTEDEDLDAMDEFDLGYDLDELDLEGDLFYGDCYPGDVPTPPQPTPGAVLTEDQVREIHSRLMRDDYDTLTGLGREFGVSDRTIRRIRDGESWTHITRA